MLILLSGWKGSGKDTAADFLVSEFGFERRAFADALKDSVAAQYGIPRAWCDDRDKKEAPLPQYPIYYRDGFSEHVNRFMHKEFATSDGVLYHTPRSLCILEGSLKRSADPNYWVKRATQNLDPLKNYVISDWRYCTEYEAVKHLDPWTFRLERFDNTASTDPSERDLDSFMFDRVISNRGSIEILHTTLKIILEKP